MSDPFDKYRQYDQDLRDAYAAGLEAAREAVANLPIPTLPERLGILTSMLFRGDVLAAIDALRANADRTASQ